jgi:pentatricopeptide repeat protein
MEAEGDAKAAIELFGKLRARHSTPPDAIVYTALLNACEKGGRWDYGLAVFDEVMSAGTVAPTLQLYTVAIRLCNKGGYVSSHAWLTLPLTDGFFCNPDKRRATNGSNGSHCMCLMTLVVSSFANVGCGSARWG